MAMLPTLPLAKRVTIMVNQLCRYILPGNVAEKCFRAQGRNERNDSITSRFAVLSNHVPGPGFLRRFQLLGGSHIRCVVVACFTEAVSNWTVIQFLD